MVVGGEIDVASSSSAVVVRFIGTGVNPRSGTLSNDDGDDDDDGIDAPSVVSVPLLLLVLLLPGLPPIFCNVCNCSSLIVCSGEMFSLISSFISLGIISQSCCCCCC